MKRSKHSLSHYHLTSMDMGQLVPIGCLEVLPGDSFQHSTSLMVRVSPQLKPVMHPVQVHVKHFYVPNRLLWSGWEDFITGESATAPPTITGAAHSEGSLLDYLGIYDDTSTNPSALAVRAYNKIYNEYFRDQDLITEVTEDSTVIQKVAWNKDYFTASRPWPQKGTAVTIPIGTTAPVKGIYLDKNGAVTAPETQFEDYDGNQSSSSYISHDLNATDKLAIDVNNNTDKHPNVYADLSSADALDVREFREAFALQRYQEARSRYGSNYVDYLRYLGLRPSDARLQRPEYLGGGRQSVSFSEVLNTASNGGVDAIGGFGGHGIAAMRSNRYVRFFEEHGFVITLMYVRPKSIYGNGIAKKFTRSTKEEYFQKELENIGAEEILNREIYAGHSTPSGTFGYSERYATYRSEQSRVSAEMRNSTSYDWHFARLFTSDPALNQTFVECEPTKRVFAEQTEDSLWVVANHSIQARRLVAHVKGGLLL